MEFIQSGVDRRGFFTRRDANAAGYADRQITRMVRRGEWVRLRRGAYVLPSQWSSWDPVRRHQVRASAVLDSLGTAVALSHVSGVVRHGVDVWGLPLDRVHVTRLDGGAGRVEGDVVHHEGFCLEEDVATVDGELVLRPQRCLLEAASRVSSEAGLCLLDSGLRAGVVSGTQLAATYAVLEHWPFMHHVEPLIAMADGRSGSVGESRGRWLFHATGLPRPILQYEVRRPDGSVAGISDWYWPAHGLLGEFDGRIKYGRLLRPGQSPADAVFEEKRREDELRELTGARMIRLVWDDLDHRRQTYDRICRAMRRAG